MSILFQLFFAAITIGFNNNSYSVNECDNHIEIEVVIEGSLQRNVTVLLSTSDLTAVGKVFT